MRLTTRQLEYIVAVADSLSFRKAAQHCHISQPALSAQIAQAEEVLGTRLFERDRRRTIPTTAAAAIAMRARKILAGLDDLSEVARGLSKPLSGQLRVGVIPSISPFLLPKVLPLLRERYPDLKPLLVEDETEKLVAKATAGELDLLILAKEAELLALETLDLFTDAFSVIVPKDHALAKRKRLREADLVNESILLLEDGHCLGEQTAAFCRTAGVEKFADFRATSMTTLVEMVAYGLGITLVPQMAATWLNRLEDIVVRPLTRPIPYRTISLAWRKTSGRGAEFAELAETLKLAQR